MDGQLEREVGSESEGVGNAEGMQPDMVTWKKQGVGTSQLHAGPDDTRVVC